jgi:hypothetical protein
MEGLDVVCAQNWVEQFRTNLADHEGGWAFNSYSLASLRIRGYVITAADFVFFAFDWSQTAQHPNRSYCGPWRDRRDVLLSSFTLTR